MKKALVIAGIAMGIVMLTALIPVTYLLLVAEFGGMH